MTDIASTPAFDDIVKAACAAWRDGKGICRAHKKSQMAKYMQTSGEQK